MLPRVTASCADQLALCTRAELLGNPLAEEPNYRLYVIYKLPSLHVFDRHVVTQDERLAAARKYATGSALYYARARLSVLTVRLACPVPVGLGGGVQGKERQGRARALVQGLRWDGRTSNRCRHAKATWRVKYG